MPGISLQETRYKRYGMPKDHVPHINAKTIQGFLGVSESVFCIGIELELVRQER